MPARRASTIVFAIENLTMGLAARSRHALTRYQPAETARDRERQFIDALSGGREAAVRPRIQDIERYAEEWAPMVPDGPDIRAAILHQLSSRYRLWDGASARVRAAMAADSPGVAASYERQFGAAVASAFVPAVEWRERLRWRMSRLSERLETMPPFWMAFALTLTETVGGGMLALPIAMAGTAIPTALLLLAVFAVVNIVTIAALVEGITRDGRMRYGNGYFGQLVSNRLGAPGRVGIVIAMFAMDSVGLLVALVGFSTVLADQTGLSALVWVAALALVCIYVIRRENLNGTIAAALAIGIVLLVLASGMIVLGLFHFDPANLSRSAAPSSVSVVGLIFGVLLYVYFGHTSAGNAARQVLRRDPSGRTLLWGNLAAMAVAAVIYSLFVLAVNGSVPAARLATESGTAVTPLAEVAGPAVAVMGTLYVILSLGLGAAFMSLGLFLQTRETLGVRIRPLGVRLRWLLAALPTIAIAVIVEVLLFFGAVTFTEPLSLIGALVLPLLAGIFPMLILAAARHSGERVPGISFRALGNPLVVALVIALYLGAVVANALFIWTDPVQQAVAAAAAVAMVVLIVVSVLRHSFRPRTVVELRADEPPGAGAVVSVVSDGRQFSSSTIRDLAAAREITLELPPDRPAELYVWAHRPTRDGDDEPLSVNKTLDGDEVTLRLS